MTIRIKREYKSKVDMIKLVMIDKFCSFFVKLATPHVSQSQS